MCFVWSGVLVKWFMRLQENKLIIISISYFMLRTQKEWNEIHEILKKKRKSERNNTINWTKRGMEASKRRNGFRMLHLFTKYLAFMFVYATHTILTHKKCALFYVCSVIYQGKQWIKMDIWVFISRFKQDILSIKTEPICVIRLFL